MEKDEVIVFLVGPDSGRPRFYGFLWKNGVFGYYTLRRAHRLSSGGNIRRGCRGGYIIPGGELIGCPPGGNIRRGCRRGGI